MARLDELIGEQPTVPQIGLTVEELLPAFRALADSPAVKDKRILFFDVREGGNLLMVQTGQILDPLLDKGQWVLLEKDAKTAAWNVVEVTT